MSITQTRRRHPRRLTALGGTAAALMLVGSATGAAHAADSSASSLPYNFGSGYSAINGTFTSVSASWTEPTATCRGGNQQTGYWVGLSGSGTIAQTGTATNCEGTTPVYYSWWEMFPAGAVVTGNVTRPGDHIQASVLYKGNNRFTLTVKNSTRGWTMTETETQNSSGGTPASANIIVEANTDSGAPGSSGNVTDFGSVTFSGISVNGKALNKFPLWSGALVDMRGVQEDSISALTGGRQFTATWLSNG